MPTNSVQVTVTGNVGHAPELRTTKTGKPMASFTVASTPRIKDEQGNWSDAEVTTWYRCSAFGPLAVHCAESIGKGDRVIAVGTVELRTYQGRDGTEKSSLEITLDDAALSLAWAHTKPLEPARRGARAENPWEADGR